MAGIALVAAKIDRAADPDRQISVDLDQAFVATLVIIIARPGFAGDELHCKCFASGQFDMLGSPPLAFRDGSIEDHCQSLLRDSIAFVECVDPGCERTITGDQLFQIFEDAIIMRKRL